MNNYDIPIASGYIRVVDHPTAADYRSADKLARRAVRKQAAYRCGRQFKEFAVDIATGAGMAFVFLGVAWMLAMLFEK